MFLPFLSFPQGFSYLLDSPPQALGLGGYSKSNPAILVIKELGHDILTYIFGHIQNYQYFEEEISVLLGIIICLRPSIKFQPEM